MVKDNERNIDEFKKIILKHCEERNWAQFHGAKDLAIGLVTEASELLEHFRFKSSKEVEELFNSDKKEKIEEEMADVLFFLVRLSQKYNIDLSEAFDKKMRKNCEKYPIEKAKGSNKKYDEF